MQWKEATLRANLRQESLLSDNRKMHEWVEENVPKAKQIIKEMARARSVCYLVKLTPGKVEL